MLSFLIGLALTLLTLVLLVPSAVFVAECLLAMLQGGDEDLPVPHVAKAPRRAILVPARDAERTVVAALRSIRPQLGPDDRLVVIADHCSDRTADMARAEGARVLEHTQPGEALGRGLETLERDPPDVVVVVDADVELEERSIDALSRLAVATHRPVQADFLSVPERASPLADVNMLSCLVAQRVRPRGLRQLELPCRLAGGAMAFPWDVISRLPPLSTHVGDARRMGIELALLGHMPLYTGHARAFGKLPASSELMRTARARADHAQLDVLLERAPRMLRAALAQGRVELFALGLDALVPPVSLLVALLVGAWALSVLGAWFTSYLWPAFLLGLCLIGVSAVVIAAWWRFGRRLLPLQSMLAIPLYMLWKVPIFVSYLQHRAQRRA